MHQRYKSRYFEPKSIDPVINHNNRPFWSVMIPTYNRETFLREALESVLNQDPGPEKMQICVVDNATKTFDVKKILDGLSRGRVEYIRHAENIGGIKNINSCIVNSRGKYVHILHDDDVVLRNFYSTVEDAIKRNPAGTIFMAAVLGINDRGQEIGRSALPSKKTGVIENFLAQQALSNIAPTQTLVVPRHIYELIGGYAERLVFTPDWEMAFRAASAGCAVAATIDEPLAAARWHSESDSARIIKGTRHIREMKMTIDELINRLPSVERANIKKNRYSFPAMAATHYASVLKKSGDRRASITNLLSAIMLEPTTARFKMLLGQLLR